jgi:hypothetical protein
MLLGLLALLPAARGEDGPQPLAVEDALRQRAFATGVPIDVSRDARRIGDCLKSAEKASDRVDRSVAGGAPPW